MSSMPRARGARVFRSSRWAPPPLLAALLLDVAIGQAAGISLSKRFHPTRNAFGPNCTFPETATCHPGYTGSSLDHVMGMYASWNTCAMPIRQGGAEPDRRAERETQTDGAHAPSVAINEIIHVYETRSHTGASISSTPLPLPGSSRRFVGFIGFASQIVSCLLVWVWRAAAVVGRVLACASPASRVRPPWASGRSRP